MDGLLQYSSSSSDEEGCHKKNEIDPQKCKHDQIIKNVVLLQSPSNGGNIFKRNHPHIQGNWCGHIYIKINDESFVENCRSYNVLRKYVVKTIRQLGEELCMQADSNEKKKSFHSQTVNGGIESNSTVLITPHLPLDEYEIEEESDYSSHSSAESGMSRNSINKLDDCESLHISLSRPFYLQEQSIGSFLSDLTKRIQLLHKHPIIIVTSLNDIGILSNDEQSRSFLTIPVFETSVEPLTSLIKILNCVLKKFGEKDYYADPKFHISIASWKYEKFMEAAVKKWIKCKNDSNLRGTEIRNGVTFYISGIHCDFGTTEKHFITF